MFTAHLSVTIKRLTRCKQKVVLAAMLEGKSMPSNMVAKTTYCLYLVKRLIVMLRCAVNITTSSFSTFSLTFKCKVCVQKEIIHNFKNHILVT